MISDPLEIANYFNEYFVNVGPNLAKKIPESPMNFKSYLDETNCNSLFLDAILESEVAKEIGQLKVTKSGGYDEMSPKVIRGISNHIVKPLTHIYNQSLLTGIIPDELKIAVVTPIYKSSDKESFSNYRPISVLTCFSKILEKLMYKRIVTFLDKQNILSERQYGFR